MGAYSGSAWGVWGAMSAHSGSARCMGSAMNAYSGSARGIGGVMGAYSGSARGIGGAACRRGTRGVRDITAPTPGLRTAPARGAAARAWLRAPAARARRALSRAARSRSPRVFRSPGVGAVMPCNQHCGCIRAHGSENVGTLAPDVCWKGD
eukprot:gene9940-biopygen2869